MQNIRFDRLNKEDGLSHSLVNTAIQDDVGYIWIASQDGLNRYDGYEFKVFRPGPGKNDLLHHWVTFLYKDSYGDIWIRYNKLGLPRYSPKTETFRTYLHAPNNKHSIVSDLMEGEIAHNKSLVHEDECGNIWVATDKGINRYRRSTDDFERIRFKGLEGVPAQPAITFIESDNEGVLFLGTSYGLVKYEPATNESQLILPIEESSGDFITTIKSDQRGHVWAGTRQKGLYHIVLNEEKELIKKDHILSQLFLAPQQKEVCTYRIFEDRQGGLWFGVTHGLFYLPGEEAVDTSSIIRLELGDVGESISQIMEDSRGRIWAAAGFINGLWVIDPSDLSMQEFVNDPEVGNSLGPNDINFLFEDNKGNLWIGHEKGGVSRANLYNMKFCHLNQANQFSAGMPHNDTYGIFKDQVDGLWLGTYGGLYRKNMQTGEETSFPMDDKDFGQKFTIDNNPDGRLAGTIEKGKNGKIWFGFFDYKVSEYDQTTGSFKNYQHHPEDTTAFRIWSMRDICHARDGSVYFAGTHFGLCRLKEGSENFEYYQVDENNPKSISDNWLYRLYEDEDGIIWVGTSKGGLNRFDPEKESFKVYLHDVNDRTSLPGNTVKCILERKKKGAKKYLWLGTENGLSRFDKEAETFETYFPEDGLFSNVVHGMLEDQYGRLWISTNAGISCFNPENEQFTNYTKEDGLQDNEFNEGAYFKDDDGWLYFGGVNGVTMFHPDSLAPNPFLPELTITELEIDNKRIMPGDTLGGRVVLEESINYQSEVTLLPKNRMISFSFAAFHFAGSSKIRYRYRLFPFETEWTEVNADKRRISYMNIPPGSYELKLECSGIDGQWGGDARTLRLEVLPPFWKTNWFRGLLMTLIFLSILATVHIRTRVLAYQKRMLTREVSVRTEALKHKSDQLRLTNEKLQERQAEVEERNLKIAEQRDNLEHRNNMLEEQKQEIQRMAELLHESDQSKLNFFTNISHEFRTPLSLIMGQTEGLLNRNEFLETKQVKLDLQLIYRNEKRLFRLINQLLEIRHMESGKLRFEPEHRNVAAFVQELLDLFQPVANTRNINLSLRSDRAEILMDFDIDKLEKIIYNLLSNAFKHTPDGGAVSVKLEAFDANRRLSIKVKNTGKGIDKASLDRIFDRFYHTDNANGELSTGIGLSLVKDLVELHNGEVQVQPDEDGTCFQVCLPMDQDNTRHRGKETIKERFNFSKSMMEQAVEFSEQAQSSKPKAKARQATAKATANKPLLLVVEDNPDMRTMLEAQLSKDYTVLTADNGEAGLEVAFKSIPDLILSDVMMPRMNGCEMTAVLKGDKRTCHIPVLMLTAKVDLDDQITGLESGADDYLVKPFNLRALHLKLRNMIDTRKALVKTVGDSVPLIPDSINVKTIDQDLLSDIVSVIEENLDDTTLNGDRLAMAVGMSKGNLYRKLKAISGMTVNIFIRTVRLKIAAQLLQKGQYNIAEVAYSVGFDNPKYFSVCFKELFGNTPRAYMNAHLEEA
jgi:signal transduction histidine kinase/ligand-binding sensor domain-containing protein/DNA-binding response OmpR family regulator